MLDCPASWTMREGAPQVDAQRGQLGDLPRDAGGRARAGRRCARRVLLVRGCAQVRLPSAALGMERRRPMLRDCGLRPSADHGLVRMLPPVVAAHFAARASPLLPLDAACVRPADGAEVPHAAGCILPCAPAVLGHAHHLRVRLDLASRLANRMELDLDVEEGDRRASRARRPAHGRGCRRALHRRQDGHGHRRRRLNRLGARPPGRRGRPKAAAARRAGRERALRNRSWPT